ncbi:MAG: CBS domain-containing protein [Acidobacteria bacterium]|nr:CBS domain-containing protein [Acidobacteriota bacterium]
MPTSYFVRDFMSGSVTTVPYTAQLLEAALTLRRTSFRHLPIVDGEKLVGIITDRDINRFAPSLLSKITAEEYNAIFENTPLSKVMTKDPITVKPDTPVQDAVEILHSRKLGCVPVVEAEKLVGILTVTDMLRLLYNLLQDPAHPKPDLASM